MAKWDASNWAGTDGEKTRFFRAPGKWLRYWGPFCLVVIAISVWDLATGTPLRIEILCTIGALVGATLWSRIDETSQKCNELERDLATLKQRISTLENSA